MIQAVNPICETCRIGASFEYVLVENIDELAVRRAAVGRAELVGIDEVIRNVEELGVGVEAADPVGEPVPVGLPMKRGLIDAICLCCALVKGKRPVGETKPRYVGNLVGD